MQAIDFQKEPSIQSMEWQYAQHNIEFQPALNQAFETAQEQHPNAAFDLLCKVITALLWDYLTEQLKMPKPLKKYAWRVLQWIWNKLFKK